MWRQRRRLILPIVLILFGISALQGCLYIPTFGTKVSGENAIKKVGDARSRKPLRVGHATWEEVVRTLGQPYVEAPDRSAMAYTWTIRNGIALWPLCFQATSLHGHRTLVLRFDQQGVLRNHELLKANDDIIQLSAQVVRAPLPEDLALVRYPASTMPALRPGQPGPSTAPATAPDTATPPPPPGPKYETSSSP